MRDSISNMIIGFLLLTVVTLAIRIIFIQLGWDLFVAPVFGLRDISLVEAFGLALLLPSSPGMTKTSH